ncbi:MAG: hypothetical protein M0R03_17550 [Novosphingobium sp.]|nr:hypothetical protein [Novosphingobium sp.]
MTPDLLVSVLLVGFTLGLLHALDPDHLITVASLSARPDANDATLRYAALWALGHGGLLVAIAAAVMLLGWTLPEALPAGAEWTVGLILIGVGASALWLRHPPHGKRSNLREKAPFAIGLIHGLAGSAAMLALIPVTLYRPAAGLAYAIVFSFGVLVGMMGFALVLDRVQHGLAARVPALQRAVRLTLGIGAIGMGAYWLSA